ncbi:MAG: cytidine deaminase [Limnochordales bacterium]
MKQDAVAGDQPMSPMRARTLSESFRFALEGIAYAFRTQRNVRIHVAAAALVALVAWAVGVSGAGLALLVVAIGTVLAAELFNTAVEAAVDLVTPDFHPLAGAAKNVAAGGVLVLAAAAVVIGYLVFRPYLPPALAAVPAGGLVAALLLAPPVTRKVMAVHAPSGQAGAAGSGQQTAKVAALSAAEMDRLVAAARAARERAYAPYSEFQVGAALLTASGEIVTGCNVENASYGATMCAERVALGTAVAAGHRQFRALAVVTDADPPAPPCGICRQSIAEFAAEDLPVILANVKGERRVLTLKDLFPGAFHLSPREEG